MLETLCDDTKSKCLRLGSGLFKCLTVSHNAREFWNLGDPAPIFFLFSFNNKVHKLLPSKLSFSLYHIGVGIQFCARLTPAFSGAASGNRGTIRTLLRGLRCNALLDAA